MNQILVTKLNNRKEIRNKIKFLSIFIVSITSVILLIIYLITGFFSKKKEERISQLYINLSKVQKIYEAKQLSNSKSIFLGKIKIPEINLEYMIFNNFDEDLVKISICKFSGEDLQSKSNICLVGHNYDDNRFFGNIKKLSVGSKIIIENLEEEEYMYIVNDIYETMPNDLSCVNYSNKFEKELTLVTCNNRNGKRIIVKAGISQ